MQRFFHLVVLLTVSLSTLVYCTESSDNKPTELDVNPYQSYMDQSTISIKRLSPEKAKKRKELLNVIKKNKIYKDLVVKEIVSVEYLEILNVISQGSARITSEHFYFEEEPFSTMINGKNGAVTKEFIVTVVALGMEANGGFPFEILKVFDNYQKKFGFYGLKGDTLSNGNTNIELPVDFDLTGFLAVVCPKNEAVLDAVYEARSKGLSNWTKDKNSKALYLSSIGAYMSYLERYYPASQYFIQIDNEMTAKQLYEAYENNAVNADNHYKGKRILVSGVITDFGTDILNKPYLSFSVGDFMAVTCYFSEEQANIVGQLSKGDNISVIGSCQGNLLGNVVIEESQIWE